MVLLVVAVAVAALVDGAASRAARGPPRLAGGRAARPVRRFGAARRRPGHAAGAGPGDVLAARGEPAAGARRRRADRRLRRRGSLRRRRLRRHRHRGRRRRVLDADGRAQAGRPRPTGADRRRQAGRRAGAAARTRPRRPARPRRSRRPTNCAARCCRRSATTCAPRWPPPRPRCRACAADDVGFSAEDTAELLATVEESIDQLTALVGNLLDSSRLAAGVVRPELQAGLPRGGRAARAARHQPRRNRIRSQRTGPGQGRRRRRGGDGRRRSARTGAGQPRSTTRCATRPTAWCGSTPDGSATAC